MTWIILLLALLALLYFEVSKPITLLSIGGLLLLFSLTHWAATASVVIFWVIYIPITLVLTVPLVRQVLITNRLMRWFNASQPEISAVERDVLDAGNIWAEKAFFKGKPDFNSIIYGSESKLTAEENTFLNNQVNTLCAMLNDWEITHRLHDLPLQAWDYIKQEKFWGLVIDKKYDGLGFSAYAHSQVITKIATKSISAALTVMVPNSLGPAEFLQHYGTDKQKNYYLPRLAKGKETACFGLTALNAGSDATAIADTGVICEKTFEGKKTLGIMLNFDKRYITLAPMATLVGLAFKLYDPDHLLGTQDKLGITLALVPSHLSGVSQGTRHDPLDLAFMNGPIRGKDVFIPLDYVIGGVANVGKGWRMLMECLSIGRSISLPALSMASASVCYRMTSAYAVVRKQFRRSIGDFEGIQMPLAAIGGLTYLMQSLRLLTLEGVDSGLRPAVASAIAKYHTTETARQIVNHAMDIHGGRAVQHGPRNYMANLYSSLPICITVEGANILTRNLIIYGQGALRCHPYLQHEIKAAMDGNEADFDRYLTQHAGNLTFNAVKVFLRPCLRSTSYQSALGHFSILFSFVSDITMALVGKELKFRENLSALLADVLSYLYIGTSILKYFDNNGKPDSEQLLMQWSLEYCLSKIEQAFNEIFMNYPKPWLGKLLRFWALPRRYNGPSNALSVKLAKFMQVDTEARNRLTSACYIGDNARDPCFRVEQAWQKMIQADESVDPEEFAKLVRDALQVDEFEGAFV
ncbi:MAG: acyl-CoA dehydrogenase [Coxiella sp. (in: Bacteria)]|nr:MAG: acyl-CoA dehydrogenase [Coxiella sp. (in: g-proteobacteria)]